jgi:two-component system, NtrC family, response regulator HydG
VAVRSVLVVDDDSGMAETLADILSVFGYAVTTVSSAVAAVGVVTQTCPDLVLMDVRMPGLSGVEALKRMKALVPKLAVIMMTAFARDDLAEEARQAAALAVLSKPLDMKRLLALLTQVARSEGPTGDARHGRDRRRPDAVPFE